MAGDSVTESPPLVGQKPTYISSLYTYICKSSVMLQLGGISHISIKHLIEIDERKKNRQFHISNTKGANIEKIPSGESS